MFHIRFIFSVCLLTRWAIVSAETEQESIGLDPIVVEAMRLELRPLDIPAAVSVVEKQKIQTASAQLSLNEALQTVPGVFVLNPYNYAQDSRIAIRGFGARSDFGIRGVRVMVDGIPATLPDGQAGVDGIDLGSAERIEIIRGPSAAIYGPASGGVIRIMTESAPEGTFVEPRFTIGDYGLQKHQLKAGRGAGPWNLLLSGTTLDYEGYRENSRTLNRMLNAKLTHEGEDRQRLTAVLNIIDYPVQDDPGGLTAAEVEENPRQARARNLQYDGGEAVEQQKLGLQYTYPLAGNHELRLNGYALQRDFSNKLPFRNGGQVAFDRIFYGAGVQYRYEADPFRVVAGVEAGQQVDDRQNYDNLDGVRGPRVLDQEEDVRNLGGYATGEMDLAEDVTLSAALRFDEVRFEVNDAFLSDGDDSGELCFQEWSPSVGLRWQPRPDLSVYSTAATSFETPTTTEFDNPDGGGFNPSLEAQTARSIELGIKWDDLTHAWRPAFDLAFFSIDMEDALVPFEMESFPGREFFRNAGSIRKEGLEASLRIHPMESLSLDLSYTLSDFRYDRFLSSGENFNGNQLPGIPEHFGNLRIDYTSVAGGTLIWNTRVVGALEADDANTTEVEEYSVSDLRLGWEHRTEGWTVAVFTGLNNVFDQSYAANIRINAFGGRYYEPAPDRNLYAGVRLRVQL